MGRPKAWLPFADDLLLPRIVRVVSEVVSPVVVVAATGQDLPTLPENTRIVRDEVEGRGPLQGIAAGIQALRGSVDVAYITSCDVPFLKPEFIRRMLELLDERLIVVPRVGGRLHPLAAIYRLEVLPEVTERLNAGSLRLGALLEAVPVRIVDENELVALESLQNVNTIEEYEAATGG
jgi:molybdopterin-guanine dinucleotide biosynthesis protein A